ncbi:MAG: hypothetical protein NTU62_00690 [Spirochaetes bacterium]|nr:hypothetical protein [Spirochaetota bacterium]
MNSNRDYLDFRQWRNIISYLLGIGMETLFVLTLAGIGALILAGFWILKR